MSEPVYAMKTAVDVVTSRMNYLDQTAAKLVDACKERGVGIGANTATRIRAVTHLDVNRADIDTALKVIGDALAA